MNIYDISQRSGYSIATVSRVINNKQNVSPKARDKILSVIEDAQYTPNIHARGLSTGTAKTIGLVCVDVSDLYLAGVVSSLERELREKGYQSLLCCTGMDKDAQRLGLHQILEQNVDAVITIGSQLVNYGDDYIVQAAERLPVIVLNSYVEGEGIYCILADDYRATIDCTTQLIDAGHSKILYTYDADTPSGKRKLEGYRKALQNREVEYDSSLEILIERSVHKAQATIEALIDSGVKFTAVLSSEDELAIGVLKAVQGRGLSVPEDVEIIGYNNSLLAKCCTPELSSIDSASDAICAMAISTLFGLFDGKRFPSKLLLSTNLVKRNTTKL